MKRSERTCCVCRSKGGKGELARLVCVDGVLVWDRQQCADGRGAYIHYTAECLSKMGQAARWERSLRLSSGTLSSAEVSALARVLLAGVTHERL
ncbi:MAG: YlxR family protein [Pseudomonadota bacterium]